MSPWKLYPEFWRQFPKIKKNVDLNNLILRHIRLTWLHFKQTLTSSIMNSKTLSTEDLSFFSLGNTLLRESFSSLRASKILVKASLASCCSNPLNWWYLCKNIRQINIIHVKLFYGDFAHVGKGVPENLHSKSESLFGPVGQPLVHQFVERVCDGKLFLFLFNFMCSRQSFKRVVESTKGETN